MKFFHLSDLHFGKMLHGYDLAQEQRAFIREIKAMAEEEKPDAIVVAGDIYDRAVPSGTAMTLLEELFLAIDELSTRQGTIEIFLIAGNHDSVQRLSYGSSFLERHHIHIAVLPPQEEDESMQQVCLEDSYGMVHFYLLPYTKPGMLRRFEGGEEIADTNAAVDYLLKRENFDWSQRNVLVSHQFYANAGQEPKQSDSETPRLYVGGLDIVDTKLVQRFDYVALGHIHSPQDLGSPSIRYCGTPYPYSVNEADMEKSVTVVEMGKKGEISCRYLPIRTEKTVKKLYGTLEELTQRETPCRDYVSITLTDEELIEQPKEYLERFYESILEIQLDNTRTKKILQEETVDIKETTPLEAFEIFFEDSTGRKMTQREEECLQSILQEVEGVQG